MEILKCEDIRKVYGSGSHQVIALDGIDLSVEKGEFVAIMDGRSRHPKIFISVDLPDPDFPMIAFWTKANANAPYICLEPWHGCAAWDDESGEFTDKPHCITLQPGESRTLGYSVKTV